MLTRPIKAHSVKENGILYTQCLLEKGLTFYTAYIPSQFAKVKEAIKIKVGQNWEDGWVVKEVWQEVDETFLDSMRNALKHHAEVSDI